MPFDPKKGMALQEGLSIQSNQIICISHVIKPEAGKLLRERAAYENERLPSDATGYDVWRGVKIEGFIFNLANRLNKGEDINKIDPTDISC